MAQRKVQNDDFMSDPTNQGAQRLKRVRPYSPPPSAAAGSSSPLTIRVKKGTPTSGSAKRVVDQRIRQPVGQGPPNGNDGGRRTDAHCKIIGVYVRAGHAASCAYRSNRRKRWIRGGALMSFQIAMNAGRPRTSPIPTTARHGNTVAATGCCLVTMVEVASTVVKTRDASGHLLRFKVVRATHQGRL
jgi:hypothetical protein